MNLTLIRATMSSPLTVYVTSVNAFAGKLPPRMLKRTASVELVRAIRAVAGGGTYVDPSLAGTLLAGSAYWPSRPGTLGNADHASRLTAREGEVLRLVARGHTNKEIAEALRIGVKTVETHKASGMGKLGLESRAALVRFAIDERWLGDNG